MSVKLSALYSQFDPIDPEGPAEPFAGRLRPILSAAPKQTGAFVNFDMEQYALQGDRRCASSARCSTSPSSATGRTSASRSRRTCATPSTTCASLLDWAKTTRHARVGAAREGGVLGLRDRDRGPERLAGAGLHAEVADPTRTTSSCTRFLLENHDWLRPAFGSHNIRSIAHALAVAEQLERAAGRYEFQMLYGMADPIKDVLVSLGSAVSASTRRTANCCPAWRTSSAGCWRTRPTNRSCGPASASTSPRSSC